MAMIRRPLVDELAVARRPREQHPSGAAAERFAHRHELRSPALERSEIARQRVAQRRTRFALVAEAVEEQLVQDHRVHRDELLAFESINEKAGGLRVIELGELLVDQIEAFHRPAVIILVVADDQPLGHAFDLGRVAGQRLYSVRHHRSSDHGRALISNLFFPKPMLALPSTANAGATMHAANTAAEIPRSAVARPFMRSLPAAKERSPRC